MFRYSGRGWFWTWRLFCRSWVLCLSRALSIGRTNSGSKTGLVSKDPGIGSFHVLSMPSMLRLVGLSTRLYASMKVLNKFLPR